MSIYKNISNYTETPDGIERVDENVNDILARKDNCYKGWKCWAGIDMISISTDGTVYSASCRNKIMGNIYDDAEINLEKEPQTCEREWCACAANLNVKKIKDEKYRKCVR